MVNQMFSALSLLNQYSTFAKSIRVMFEIYEFGPSHLQATFVMA